MKNLNKTTELYGILGRVIVACGVGILGFVLGGLILALIGVFAGIISGHYIEKGLITKVY
ncbi:MAG: hypothetical protein K2X08_07695 [Chlamydiales bacterium]|nr:hypothetical protein [Chlamydiales bacterium]MBY0529646.1 hypothetical protein [Rhabdochlamydiaceae bacterium]